MTSTSAIPVTIAPEATTQVAELGLEKQFRQMLEHIQQTVSGIRTITVNVQPPFDLGGEPCVIFDVLMEKPPLGKDPTEENFSRWQIDIFPPDVYQHFIMLLAYG